MDKFSKACAMCGKTTRDPHDGVGVVITNPGNVLTVHMSCWGKLSTLQQEWIRVYETRPPSGKGEGRAKRRDSGSFGSLQPAREFVLGDMATADERTHIR